LVAGALASTRRGHVDSPEWDPRGSVARAP